jgi:hypothetical protein
MTIVTYIKICKHIYTLSVLEQGRAGKPMAQVPKVARQRIFLARSIQCCPSFFPTNIAIL